MKKSVIALMLSIVMAVGSVGGSSVFAAETTAQEEEAAQQETSDYNEKAEVNVSSEVISEEESSQIVEDSSEMNELVQEADEQMAAQNSKDVENSTEDVIEEPSASEKEEDIVIDETEQVEEGRESASESVDGENIAQAIWTAGNKTLTFYYGPLVLEGGLFNGKTVTEVFSGTTVTNSSNRPSWTYDTFGIRDAATSVVFDTSFLDVKPVSTSKWFLYFKKLSSVELSGLDTSAVRDMSAMFYGCENLPDLDLSGFDTSGVTTMNELFKYCKSLISLDLISFNTSKVTSMASMFSYCSGLTSLDLSGFDTSAVQDMRYMFWCCESLSNLDLSSFDTPSLTNMEAMFYNCGSLTSLDLSSFDTSNVTTLEGLVDKCSSLISVDLSGFDDTNVESTQSMFSRCNKLETIYCTDSSTSFQNDKNLAWDNMFYGCTSLVGRDGDARVYYDSNEYGLSMAKSASLGGYFTPKSEDEEGATSGTCGPGLTWALDDEGTLAIAGTGEMYDYDMSSTKTRTPWDKKTADVMNVTIGDTVSTIGNNAFNGCINLTSLMVPFSVISVGSSAFANCNAIEDIYFTGNAPFIEADAFAGLIAKAYYPENDDTWYDTIRQSYGGTITWIPWEPPAGNMFVPVEPAAITNAPFYFRTGLKNDDSIQYSFNYNDSWAFSDISDDRYKLMQTSIRVAMAAFGAKEDRGYGERNIKKMMSQMGFRYTADSIDYPEPSNDSIGSAIGLKNIKSPDGTIKSIILVALRGGGYGEEWGGDFRVGSENGRWYDGKYHEGFAMAANDVENRLSGFIGDNKEYISDDLKIWVTGYSRAAATSNLVAADLISGAYRIDGVNANEVLAFCFECPKNVVDSAAYSSMYNNIINVVNPIDFVPKVAFTAWGFTRYGTTYYIPSKETASSYTDSYKVPMVVKYLNLCDQNGIELTEDRVVEVAGQASVLDSYFDWVSTFIRREHYYKYYEESFMDLTRSLLGGSGTPDWGGAVPVLLNVLDVGLWKPVSTGMIVGMFKKTNTGPGPSAHYPELCMSWIDSLGSFTKYKTRENSKYRSILVNCPVDVTVRDSEGNIVGHIENDEVEEIEYGIVARIDGDGQKVFVLPQDEEYIIDITATDEGEVNYIVKEYNYDSNSTEKVINYKNIGVNAGDELRGTATEIPEEEEAEYTLQYAEKDTVIEPDEILADDEVVEYTVEITSDENGTVTGGGRYVKGEFAKVTATADEGYEFAGWYVNGKRVSTEIEYRFAVDEDIALKAEFSKVSIDFKGKTTRGDMFNLANNVKVTWKEVPGAKYYKVYREGITDKKETRIEPVIVTERLIGWDKETGLTNGHAYRYKIVASLTGKGDSSGDSTLSYSKVMYRLKTVVIRSVKNTAPGKVTVKYDKTTSGDSYVLQYCEREDMVGAKTKVVLGADNTSYTIGGLKKGKTYYISIRVRKKVNGIDYYTTFGVPKKIKVVK